MCVLLADDDLVMQQVMAAALRVTGYDVEEASDGRSAIAMFEERPDQFRVLVTDVQLPGSYSGRAIVEHVHARRPDLPIVITASDWAALGASWHRDKGSVVLLKPYQQHELVRLVGILTGNVKE